MDTPSTASSQLGKKEAESLARHFNKCFGHATMYGVEHQMCVDSIKPFFVALAASFERYPLITVTIERESIVFEEWNVDKIVNAKKLSAHFKKANLQSFSFEKGLEINDITAFLDITANTGKYPTVDLMKTELAARKTRGIRLNYITYRKMSTDEEVVNKDLRLAGLAPGKAALPPGHDPGDSFSLTKVLSNPKAAAGALFYPKSDGMSLEPQSVVSSMEKLGEQIRSAGGGIASDNLMEAILVLREECIGHVSDFKTAGIVKDDMQSVLGEVEKLTHDTIIYLMKEEYKSGEVSTKRLAQILRRMLPDARELRTFLPHLKRALLDEGMPFVKYIELVNELRRELEGDDVVATLAQATREMGVTPDEVMDEIKKNPADAARLIILAAELRRSGAGNDRGLDQVLTDYIETVSRQMAVNETGDPVQDGGRQLGAVLQKIESNFLDNLKKQGVEQSVLTALTARLTERMPYLLDITKTEWLRKTLELNPGLDTGMLARLIAGTVQQAYDIDTQRDSLFALFTAKGFSPDQINEILQQAATRVAAATQQIDLPRGVLSSSAIMYFLERECKLSLRYHNPFSLLIVSILRIVDNNGAMRPLTPDERPLFMKNLIALLKHVMRDIDMIGVPSSSAECISFVILPMTAESNTYNLVERLRREMADHVFESGVLSTKLSLAISITGFDEKTMPDKTAFLKTALAHHRAVEKIRNAGITEKK